MPYESGGRADKQGNEYESMWRINWLLRLANEEISSLVVEGIGKDEKGIDIWVTNRDGTRHGYQCKGRNGANEYWSIAHLKNSRILMNMKAQLDHNPKNYFTFVSAVPCTMFHDICNRARNSNGNPEDFYKYQIVPSDVGSGGIEVEKAYCEIANAWGLDISHKDDRNKLYSYIIRCDTICYPDGDEQKKHLLDKIQMLFMGNPEQIYSTLSNYVQENNLLGRSIDLSQLLHDLKKRYQIDTRYQFCVNKVSPQIETLNNEFQAAFRPINGHVFHRRETTVAFQILQSGHSLIIHGKAGMGKSGCVQELVGQLQESGYSFLALKLDRQYPEISSENFGRTLGLPSSPVHCLNFYSSNKPAVLLLDQLDAIRWTHSHSAMSISICKTMIREVESFNKSRKHPIRIVLICRTFDLENDEGLKSLILVNRQGLDYKGDSQLNWDKLEVKELCDAEVKDITGDIYEHLHDKLRQLIHIPSNLYIWCQLDREIRNRPYLSQNSLIEAWWEQLSIKAETRSIATHQELIDFINVFVERIQKSGRYEINKSLLSTSPYLLEFLSSSGLIQVNFNKISFIHQSFYDCFLIRKNLTALLSGDSILNIIGDKSMQTPMRRYQIEILLQRLMLEEPEEFLIHSKSILRSSKVQFYYKHIVLECLGGLSTLPAGYDRFVLEYVDDSYWEKYFYHSVYWGHMPYVDLLIKNGIIQTWLHADNKVNEAMQLLQSVYKSLNDDIVDLLSPLAFKSGELDKDIQAALPPIEYQTDKVFAFQLRLFEMHPDYIWNYYPWSKLIETKPNNALQFLIFILQHPDININTETKNDLCPLGKKMPSEIIQRLIPVISELTNGYISEYDPQYNKWHHSSYNHSIQRQAVLLLKYSLMFVEDIDLLDIAKMIRDSPSLVINEIYLSALKAIKTDYADQAICQLLVRPECHFYDYTSEEDTPLSMVERVIKKHSPYCSTGTFQKLENTIYYFHQKNESIIARYRYEHNYPKDGQREYVTYYPHWGQVQKALLPLLPCDRISRKSRDLINVLNRNPYVSKVRRSIESSHAKNVISPIAHKLEQISENQWKQIILNKEILDNNRNSIREDNEYFIESGLFEFISSFSVAAKNNPLRFANLAITLGDSLPNAYLPSVISLIDPGDEDDENCLDLATSERLITTFYKRISEDEQACKYLCWGLEKRADEKWSYSILELLLLIVSNSDNSCLNINESASEDDDIVWNIENAVLNSTKGTAAKAIAQFLWNRPKVYRLYKNIIEYLVHSTEDYLRFASLECVLAAYNIDKESAERWYMDLLERDWRIIAAHGSWQLTIRLYSRHKDLIDRVLLQAYMATNKHLSEKAATDMTALWLYKNSDFYNMLIMKNKTQSQYKGILRQAISCYGDDEYYSKCKNLIELLLDDYTEADHISFASLFRDNKIRFPEDSGLIIKIILKAKNKDFVLDSFLEYASRNSIDIYMFKDVLLALLNDPTGIRVSDNSYGFIGDTIVKAVLMLTDSVKEHPDLVDSCIDLWDKLYENELCNVRELTTALSNI